MQAINNLAATDENKLKIVKAGALPHYVKLLNQKRDAAEQKEAAHGMWMLAFECKDEIVKQDRCLEGRPTRFLVSLLVLIFNLLFKPLLTDVHAKLTYA